MLARAVRAVGRIEVEGHPTSSGSARAGWLRPTSSSRTGTSPASSGAPRQTVHLPASASGPATWAPRSTSVEEIGRTETAPFHVLDILHIEDDDGPDMAFAAGRRRVRRARRSPSRSRCARRQGAEQQVAVIGYPARDSRIPDPDLMQRIFGDVYDKKRLAPGRSHASNGGTVTHDCSTLGGNSGSVVLDLETDKRWGCTSPAVSSRPTTPCRPAVAERLPPRRSSGPGHAGRQHGPQAGRATNQAVRRRRAAVSGRTATWTLPLQVTVTLAIRRSPRPGRQLPRPRRAPSPTTRKMKAWDDSKPGRRTTPTAKATRPASSATTPRCRCRGHRCGGRRPRVRRRRRQRERPQVRALLRRDEPKPTDVPATAPSTSTATRPRGQARRRGGWIRAFPRGSRSRTSATATSRGSRAAT